MSDIYITQQISFQAIMPQHIILREAHGYKLIMDFLDCEGRCIVPPSNCASVQLRNGQYIQPHWIDGSSVSMSCSADTEQEDICNQYEQESTYDVVVRLEDAAVCEIHQEKPFADYKAEEIFNIMQSGWEIETSEDGHSISKISQNLMTVEYMAGVQEYLGHAFGDEAAKVITGMLNFFLPETNKKFEPILNLCNDMQPCIKSLSDKVKESIRQSRKRKREAEAESASTKRMKISHVPTCVIS